MGLKISTKEEIYIFAKETLKGLLEQSTENILQEIEKKDSLVKKEFLQAIESVLSAGFQMQQRKEKQAIAFVHIFYLRSAILTDTYELQIYLFDKRSYLDPQECYGFWIPRLFIKYFQEDMKKFYEKAQKHLIQFNDIWKQDIKVQYYNMYLALIGQFIIKEGAAIISLSSYQKIEKEEEIKILFGGYCDSAVTIYPPLQMEVMK